MPPSKPADRRPPVAVSYLRFSTPEQGNGDSLRRQTKATEEWCRRNNVALDDTIRDRGVSAFKGRHRSDTAALGRFLDAVRAGNVPRGSFLIVENLDRLTREELRTAVRLVFDILDAGVSIVQLNPERVFRHDGSDMTDVFLLVIELSRGHSESRMKSSRTQANWEKAFTFARAGKPQPPRRKDGKVTAAITGRLPGWVTDEGGRLALIPDRAAVVKRIFDMSAAGYGLTSIVKKLKAEKVPAFGGREVTDDGRTRKVAGDVYGSGEWRTAYVRSILSDRRALGEYQPRNRAGEKLGDPIPDYYPPAVTAREFYKARSGAAGRRNPPGAIGKNVANLFGGLLVNALPRDGDGKPLKLGYEDTYYAAFRSDHVRSGPRSYRVLLNRSSVEGDSPAYTFPYNVFEAAVLSELRELDPAEVFDSPRPGEADVLRGELNWVRERRAELAQELLKGHVSEIGDALRGLDAREAELRGKLEGMAAEEAVPLARTCVDTQTLIDRLGTARDPEDVRLRLRAALRRLVDSVYVLVVPRGRDRIAAVQVNFRGSEAHRNYLVFFRSAKGNQKKLDPARWAVRSVKHPDDGLPFEKWDLRHRTEVMVDTLLGLDMIEGAEGVRSSLERYPTDIFEQVIGVRPSPTLEESREEARESRRAITEYLKKAGLYFEPQPVPAGKGRRKGRPSRR